ncbi:hypothetical protein KY290_017299 [Solanum tuberosum]|uniref:Uncharacterized protein n=1 Tax=Solanum tuberosum TaxID=4113 RepID=A0ABQ7VCS8_SOLTU|nr:hypothetical protein KY290_017299 [Solanum tuberosum]
MDHHPIKQSIIILSTKYHHPINGSTSSYQWINIILPMDHQQSIIILSMDQHLPGNGSISSTNGSSTKHHHPINGPSISSRRWIIKHYPINGASTSSPRVTST